MDLLVTSTDDLEIFSASEEQQAATLDSAEGFSDFISVLDEDFLLWEAVDDEVSSSAILLKPESRLELQLCEVLEHWPLAIMASSQDEVDDGVSRFSTKTTGP